MAPELRDRDRRAVRAQLGHEPTTAFSVVVRCSGDHPLVIRNAPVAADGSPFPTTHWLTCPDAVKEVSRLESTGAIARLNERFEADEAFRRAVDAAHDDAAADRARDLPGARAWGGVGGTGRGLKCLHAHYANHLAGGADVVGLWVAERVEPVHGPPGERVAVIDQGTNSCRLLVLGRGAVLGATDELARDMIITRLGQGVDRHGELAPDAVERTLGVIARYVRRAAALHAVRLRVGFTSAVRDAANREPFVDRVRRLAPHATLEVIDGQTEAALSFTGGTWGLGSTEGPFAVLDIGGGSTELVTGLVPGRAEQTISMQMGSVRLTERHVGSDPPGGADLSAMRAEIGAVLEQAAAAVPAAAARTLVAVGGTATTVQAMALGIERYDPDLIHRTWLALDDAARIADELAAMTIAQRDAIEVMAPGRGEVIVAGATILVEVMRRFVFERTLVSETDILDGLAFELLGVR